jgi:BAHD acyltransferase
MIATKELHLSVIDQTVYRQNIRHLLIFPFPDISYADDALHAVRAGLSLALHHYPFLAGTIKADHQQGS